MMNKQRIVIGLVVLVLLAMLAVGVLRSGAMELAQPKSPLPTPQPAWSMTAEPTPPSEDWPTLGPREGTAPPPPRWPTGVPWPPSTPTPWVPQPTSTRPPRLAPLGSPAAGQSALYYVVDNSGYSELHVAGMDEQGEKQMEFVAIDEALPGSRNLVGLYPSPDSKYLVAQTAGDGRSVYIIDLSSGRVSCLLDEPIGCRGDFRGWTPDGQVLFQPLDAQPGALRATFGVVIVDFRQGEYEELDTPIDSKGYSTASNLTMDSTGSRVAYSTTDWTSQESAIWTQSTDGDRRLMHKVPGWVVALSWSSTREQLLFCTITGSASELAELWVVNSDGGDARLLSRNVPKATERRYQPVWSPDGHHIAFVQMDDPLFFSSLENAEGELAEPGTNIYVIDVETGRTTQASALTERNNSFPTWSPDGEFVAFVSTIVADEDSQYGEIRIVRVNGDQVSVATEIARSGSALAWLAPPAAQKGEEQ